MKINKERQSLTPKVKQTKIKRKFTVKLPDSYRKMFFFLAYCCVTLGIVIYSANFIRFGTSEIEIIIILGLVIPALLFGLGVIMRTWRLDVEEDRLQYRNFLGIKKEVTFNQLSKLVLKNKDTVIIYSEGKRFGMLTSYFEGLHYFYQRCEQEQVEVQLKSNRPLTKRRLYVESIKTLLGIMIAVSTFIVTLMLVIRIRDSGWGISVFSALWESLLISFFLISFTMILALPMSLKGFILIKKQEKMLGFRFNEEMKKYNICSENYEDDNWFIDVDLSRAFAFRKGYIMKISKIRRDEMGVGLWEAIITDINNKNIKIQGSEHTLRDLKEWRQRQVDR